MADAKGAIYLTAKNGTFPITLTSLKARDDTTQPHTPKILSATAKNLSQDADQDNWGDGSDEMLFSNYANSSYDDVDATYMWKSKRSINDAVSKNITLVLENLLKNYENSQLPTHGKGKSHNLSYRFPIKFRIPIVRFNLWFIFQVTPQWFKQIFWLEAWDPYLNLTWYDSTSHVCCIHVIYS